ncbi:MAG TPA: hemerythrin domain-containing protein [Vicinamibacterales bacterium]|jgi:hemerythrin superfamily protein|nr:hemerythrin domain-containing protein [Vicinamibacterales bacterium]
MDALDLIKQDHKRLKKLLQETLEAKEADRESCMDHLRTELVAHERIEEEVLYPRLRDEKKARESVLEGYEEHHVADVILDELLDVPPETDVWKAKVKVLKENVEHHMDEEESELFKKARAVLDSDELHRLGDQMAEIKRSAEE